MHTRTHADTNKQTNYKNQEENTANLMHCSNDYTATVALLLFSCFFLKVYKCAHLVTGLFAFVFGQQGREYIICHEAS